MWNTYNAHCFDVTVNFFGMVRCCKAFLPIFKNQVNRDCRIINITSMAGRFQAVPAMSAYAASKHAANAFSHGLRAECRSYVQVTTVNPTFHSTPLVHNVPDTAQTVWAKVDDATKQQYGEGPSKIDFKSRSLSYTHTLFLSPLTHQPYFLWGKTRSLLCPHCTARLCRAQSIAVEHCRGGGRTGPAAECPVSVPGSVHWSRCAIVHGAIAGVATMAV
jgi:short chain dehydrogenase